jgi:hypothetical protein
MLNKHTRRRFVWWFDSFRAKEDPFTSIIKAGVTVHNLKRKETKQKCNLMGNYRNVEQRGCGSFPEVKLRMTVCVPFRTGGWR